VPSTPCSDAAAREQLPHATGDDGDAAGGVGSGCGRAGRSAVVLALEGMPGAGKTTLATTLSRHGHLVVPEYAAVDGSVIALNEHPDVDADDPHQRNWLRKHQLVTTAGAGHTTYDAIGGSAQPRAGAVWVDRDWTTALAYAYSLDDQPLLAERVRWAIRHLAAGRLASATAYLVLHLDPGDSLRRRAGRLDAAHPWSMPGPLERLAEFYRSPADAVMTTSPELAAVLADASWVHLDEPTPPQAITAAAELLRGLSRSQLNGRRPAATAR